MQTINMVVIGSVPPVEVEMLRQELERVFDYQFKIYARVPLPEECYLEKRAQYDATCLLNRVLRYPGFRVLGVVSADITFTDYNFLLGLAAFEGRGALISVHRLRHSDPNRYLARLKKEAMHELGHTFGLKHCDGNCVMRFSSTVFDVDNKPAEFCEVCSGLVGEHLR